MLKFDIPSFLSYTKTETGYNLFSTETGVLYVRVSGTEITFSEHYHHILPAQTLRCNYPYQISELLKLYTPILQHLDK